MDCSTNIANEEIVKKYRTFLTRKKYANGTSKESGINKLRQFTVDVDFDKLTVSIVQKFLIYLKDRGYSDPYIASLGTELRRFFKYLERNKIATNIMAAFIIPAKRRERRNITPLPIDQLKELHKKLHPRG